MCQICEIEFYEGELDYDELNFWIVLHYVVIFKRGTLSAYFCAFISRRGQA